MATFNATRKDYDPDLDIRLPYHRSLAKTLRATGPNGALWLLVAARRMGKSWTLQGVRHALGTASGAVFDLRNEWTVLLEEPPCTYLLLDEPGFSLTPDRATTL